MLSAIESASKIQLGRRCITPQKMDGIDLPSKRTQRRYDRLAFAYDIMEAPLERFRFAGWRQRLRNRIKGPAALEVGVGTGKNFPYYPSGVQIVGVDLSPRMLANARRKASNRDLSVDLREMDVQNLDFPDHRFDTVFATFVFCSVPDPVDGLRELRRVCTPTGRLLLLEHMRPENVVLGLIFDALNPMVVRMMGANINRRTMDNIRSAGWNVRIEEKLSSDIVRWIEAVPWIEPKIA
jgi:phosphatidylethanolamine/phosphatidyl-N-methylethanolamine N-methyltransferase